MLFDRIVEAAKEAGLSFSDIEQSAGLGKNTIYNWKKTQPKAETLMRVAVVLGVSTDYLLGRDENPVITAAAAHFDPAKLTDEGRAQYEAYIQYLAEKFSREE